MDRVTRADVPGLVAHFEAVLGPVRSGWMSAPTGELMPFQVVRYSRGADVGSLAYSSLGFSRHQLRAPDGSLVRQELLVLATPGLPVEYVLGVMTQAAQEALRDGRALRRGEVLGPVVPPVPGSAMAALYVALPVYFPDEFTTWRTDDGAGEPVDVLWLVPVTDAEAGFVRQHGWESFEELLEAQDPDLVDVYRGAVRL